MSWGEPLADHESSRAALRTKLVHMRAELVEKLVREGVDGGMIALLGSVGAALAAVDAVPEDVEVAARAVVSDDGTAIKLTFYSKDGAAPVHGADRAT